MTNTTLRCGPRATPAKSAMKMLSCTLVAMAAVAATATAGQPWGVAPDGTVWTDHSTRFINAPALKFADVQGGAEVVVMTPTLAIDLRAPEGTERGAAVALSKFDHAVLGDKAWKYDVAAAEELKAISSKNGWPLWDMFTPAYGWLFKTGLPYEFFSRDYVHSGELGKQIIGRIAIGCFMKSAGIPVLTSTVPVSGD